MSIKTNCDHNNCNYGGLSPRRDVAKKRLRLSRRPPGPAASPTSPLVLRLKHFTFLAKVCKPHICILLLIILLNSNASRADALLVTHPTVGLDEDGLAAAAAAAAADASSDNSRGSSKEASPSLLGGKSSGGGGGGHYLDKLDNLERSVAAVLIKVAYGTTSTTKRSIPDNGYVPSLTTVATPPLTTLRYLEKSPHQQQINLHHRNYELDLERDHALPTSAPNADILKSNSNPTYPNPNRHHNHDRDRHRHLMNATPSPSIHNLLKKGQPTVPMYPGDMPSYSPPARSFFTPPLPPEYQNPFADKPTLRGTNNDGGIVNTGSYANRRPIPPPSLMPGHERIPFRPPDLNGQPQAAGVAPEAPEEPEEGQRKKALNTPSQKVNNKVSDVDGDGDNAAPAVNSNADLPAAGRVHFPSISRILSGANGKKEAIPEVLLKQATSRPAVHAAPSSSLIENGPDAGRNPNINHSKNQQRPEEVDEKPVDAADKTSSYDVFEQAPVEPDEPKTQPKIKMSTKSVDLSAVATNLTQEKSLLTSPAPMSGPAPPAAGKEASKSTGSKHINEGATWAVAWNIHVYLSVILFTILAVYSIFKIIFYDKLTHLFNQSYFICIHSILIVICVTRIFYLCYDAYNIHATFHSFVSEILLNLPATFITISFSVLILFLLIKSLNHKNNRYSALIRPLTVVVGSSVHVGLCITLHYVESYTANQSQQFYQQQLYRNGYKGHPLTPPPPHRVLSLICQIIYIFICLSLGLLYLYMYRLLKRVLRSKSQNYIHGYQNLSYAIHITIATALLFVLLAALQIFGAISISTTRPLITAAAEMDWLQWGYQFSLRLIEIAIITLMSWVAGLKTGGTSGVLQREKTAANHNVAGFFLPCTSSSSQEHFETDYPAVCNANTNLHTYTLRTGKPIYDDNFALNSLGGQSSGQRLPPGTYDTGSLRSDFMTDPQTDHYENPNFELRGQAAKGNVDNCYSEPLNPSHSSVAGYDFSNFERPHFGMHERPSSRNEHPATLKSAQGKHMRTTLDRANYENPERRSSNSTHSCASASGTARYPATNSFERRSGVRKSGTLNNIGGVVHGRNGSSSSSSSSSRPSGVQTLSACHNRGANINGSGRMMPPAGVGVGGVPPGAKCYYRNPRSSLERSSSSALQQYMLPSDEELVVGGGNAERANLINGSASGGNLAEPQLPSATTTPSQSSNIIPGGGASGVSSGASSGGDSANSGSMLVAEHGFVRFRALDDINNAQGVGIHNASIRTTGRAKEKRYTNNT